MHVERVLGEGSGSRLWSVRAMRSLLVSVVFLCLFAAGVRAQGVSPSFALPPAPAPGQGGSVASASASTASSGDGLAGLSAPVVYMANNEYPEQIIRNVAYSAGLSLGSANSDRARRSQVSGRLSAGSLSELVSQLGRNHGFDFFVHGATLHLYDASDWRTQTIYVGFRIDEGFRESLAAYGLLNPRFKLLPRPDQESLVVTAPRQYIALIERTLKAEREQNTSDMMVFRLKYAAVDDRVMTLRDRQVVTPGVATLLRGILFGTGSGRSGPGGGAPGGNGGAVGGFVSGLGNESSHGGNSVTLLPGLPALQGMPSFGGMVGGVTGSMAGGADMQGNGGYGVVTGGGGAGIGTAAGYQGTADQTGRGAAGNAQSQSMVTVQADVRTNSIIIRDRASREPVYRKLISQLDVPLDMVEIEAVLIDIDQRRLDELGVQWSASTRNVRMDFPSAGALNSFGVDGSTAVVADRSRFVARLQALIADNDAKVLAKPTILTLDNLSGVIDLTQTFYTRVQGERVANVVPVVAGSLLRVSPRIVRDATGLQPTEVQLQVDIEDGSLKDRVGLDLPTVQKNAISTQASILSEQAILIGGYTRESEEQTTFKVPILGDLPFIGGLMRSRSSNTQKMTRLFLITPRIVSASQRTGSVSEQVRQSIDRDAQSRIETVLPKSGAVGIGRMSTELGGAGKQGQSSD